MRIKIKRSFRAVLSLLVTVMLLVGVMPLSAVQVHAADLIVYFAPEIYKGSDYFSGAPYIYAWGGTYSAGRQIMTLVPNSETTYGHKIYMYNFGSTNPSGATIIPSSTGWNNQTENITPQNGYVYYITKQNSNNKLDYASVSSLSEACKATIYFSKNMGTYRLHTDDAFINIWDGDTKVIKKVKMDWFGTIQGFYVYTTYALLGNTISFEDSNGNDTETTADIHDNYLYYVKLSYSKYEVFGFPYSHLNLAYLSSSDTFSATKDMNVIVDAAGTATFKQNSELNYVNATLYDYFSDYEIIEGIPRSGGMKGGVAQTGITAATMSDSWEDPYKRMPLLTFDKALSDFYGDGYSHHLYFGDIHEEQDGYSFGMYNNNHWNLKYENSTSGLTYKIGNNSYYNQYQQLYHDNNSTRRSGLNVTDQSPSAFSTAMGLYAQTLGTYTAKPTEGETQAQKETRMNNNAKRLKLVGGKNAKWFDTSWLESGNSMTKMIGTSYNVDFPFWTLEGLSRTIKIGSNTYTRTGDYYYINSENASHALRLHKDTSGQYYLKETGEGVYNFSGNDTDVINAAENVGKTDEQLLALIDTTYGFFPFNSKQDFYTGGNTSTIRNLMDYKLRFDRTNYCFGTYMEIPFTLTNNNGTVDGRTLAAGGTPITFTFSGDDDLLVYIDGQLVLDIGGNHGKVQGEINLQQKKSWVSQAKTSNGSGEATGVTWEKDLDAVVKANLQNITIPSSITNNNGVKTLADALCAKGDHVMEIFYVERGLFDSNMEIMYNLPVKENRSFTINQNITSPTSVTPAESRWDSTFTGDTNVMTNYNNIKLGTNVQFSSPVTLDGNNQPVINFSTLLGSQEYHGDKPNRYMITGEANEQTFGTDDSTYTVLMGNAQTLTYVNDFIKPYDYDLKVSEGNIFIKTGTDPDTGADIYTNTGQPASYLFKTGWTLAKLSGTPSTEVPTAGPVTDHPPTTGSGSRPRVTKTTSTSSANTSDNTCFDFRGTVDNPDQIVFGNVPDSYTLQVSKEFHRKANDNTSYTFTIKVEFDNVGGLNLEEPNAATPAADDNDGFGVVLPKTLTFTFDSSEGTGTGGTTKTQSIVVPANTLYKITETGTVNGYDKSGEVSVFKTPSPNGSGNVPETIVNQPPSYTPIILKIQKVWENTDTLPDSISFKVEKSTDSGTNWSNLTGTVVNANGQPISDNNSGNISINNGKLTLNRNCAGTLDDGRTVWVVYVYSSDNLSNNSYVYKVTEYDVAGTNTLAEDATFKPSTVTFKVKYSDTTGLINNGSYNNVTQTGLTNPQNDNDNYGNGSQDGGRVLTLSVINRAFIKIRMQSYFTQTDENLMAATPSTSPYVKMKVQRLNGSTWQDVVNSAGANTSAVSVTTAALTDTETNPNRKYFEYVLAGEYDPDYQYRVLEYTQDNSMTPVETPNNNTNFNSAFTTISYSFDGGNKKNNREGTDLDKVVNNNVEEFVLMTDTNNHSGYGITLAVLNSGDGSSNTPETGGHGGYIPIAGGFIVILLAGAGYFIYKKRIFA